MIYTSKRHGVKDFIKSRNNIIYIAISFIFIAVIVITVISINRYHKNKDTNNGSKQTSAVNSKETTADTVTEPAGAYSIKINLANCTVNIFDNDILVKQMLCGINEKLKTGEYLCIPSKSKRNTWFQVSDSFYRYYTNLGNEISFHSAGYKYKSDKNSINTSEYNSIGTKNETYGITLTVEDSKWIFEHCSTDSTVEVYEDSTEKVDINFIKIPEGINWDPTDKSEGTPWCDTKVKSLECPNKITLSYGVDISVLRSKIKALDENDNDVSNFVLITGDFDLKESGVYDIELLIVDYSGEVLKKTVSIVIKEKPTEETSAEEETTEEETTKKEKNTTTDAKETTEEDSNKETTEIESTVEAITTTEAVIVETTTAEKVTEVITEIETTTEIEVETTTESITEAETTTEAVIQTEENVIVAE